MRELDALKKMGITTQLKQIFRPPRDDGTASKFTPLSLCQRCQAWGRIDIHNITPERLVSQSARTSAMIREFVSIEQLTENRNCPICASILDAYHVRSQALPHLQSWPSRRIVVCMSGPFYLDRGFDDQGILSRYPDLSDPDYLVIKMFLELEVKCLPPINPEDNVAEQSFTKQVGAIAVASDEVQNASTAFTITPQFKMKYSNEKTPILCGIERWEVPFFDINVLRGWLKHCDDTHGPQCVDEENEHAILPKGFRVIDTQEMSIIEPNNFVRYAALSYVWADGLDGSIQLEKSNVDSLGVPGCVNKLKIPGIISDAIALCRDLGERYLWVDRLCIVQDDQVTKPIQINGMDKIYRSAVFTIVAALNIRNGAGLPGFTGRAKLPRSSVWSVPHAPDVEGQGVKVDGIISSVVDTSLWNKRGWTFQERLLSRRRLFITESQVIYECSKDQATETLTWVTSAANRSPVIRDPFEDKPGAPTTREEASKAKIIEVPGLYGFYGYNYSALRNPYAIKGTPSIREYCVWVKDYSTRKLSFGTDILKAFSGVGNSLSAAFGSRMLYGLPERSLGQCLLWSSTGLAGRRGEAPDIPSWSWASSLNPVDYEWHCGGFDTYFLSTASVVYFHYQDPEKGLRKLDVGEGWIQSEITIGQLSKLEELPALKGKHIPGEWRTNRDWRECPQNPWQTFKRQALDPDACRIAAMFPGSLIFNTTVASLAIDHLPTARGTLEKYDRSNASIHNQRGEAVGIVGMVDFNWVEAHRSIEGSRKLFDFVVLSGGLQKYTVRNNCSFWEEFDKIWLLYVMLVERLPCKPFVARRVAIGTVTMCKWKECEPRWETVVLC
ncbi:hypothetical protein AAE478_006107 [Parahypoxylon ruwenzoriense]